MNKLQQECKDEVANRYGFANWEGLTFSTPTQSLIDEAMQLYAERYAVKFIKWYQDSMNDHDRREDVEKCTYEQTIQQFNKTQ
jgi:hypothetical protein